MDTIVVDVDGSEKSKDALRFALEEARRWGAKLHVVHAFWEWEPIPGTEEIEQERDGQERDAWLAALVGEVAGEVADVEIVRSTVEPMQRLPSSRRRRALSCSSSAHGGMVASANSCLVPSVSSARSTRPAGRDRPGA